MNNTNCLLDMDGVLADFIGGAIKVCNNLTGKNYTSDEYAIQYGKWGIDRFYNISIEDLWRAIDDTKDYWYNLEMLPWAKELYEFLSSKHEVTIVTSPPLQTDCATQKLNWLKDNLNITPPEVFIGSRKYLMAGNGFLVDDWNVNIEMFQKAGGFGVLIPSNWNTVGLDFYQILNSINKQIEKRYEH